MPLIIALTAKYLIFLCGAVTAVLWLTLPNTAKLKFALEFAGASLLSILLSQTIAHFYFDARPFIVQHKTPLIPHVPDNGFPSDHALLSGALAALVTPFNLPLGIVLWLLALLIGAGRVLALVHHPIDIFGSFAIAVFSAFVVWHLRRWFVLSKRMRASGHQAR